MQIKQIETILENDLLSKLKRVRLRGCGQPLIYENASLEIYSEVDLGGLVPAQKYVLSGTVDTIIDLYESLKPMGFDIFSLRGGLLFWTDLAESPIPILPPIIEESKEKLYGKIRLINDGMHRVFAAKKLGKYINVVLATNVPEEFPYYAFPLEGGWGAVEEIEEIPDNFQKKNYRQPDNYKALFRDFNAVFEGVQKQRKNSNPPHIKE